MRLSQKLVLFVLAAAVLPLGGVGFWVLGASERELLARLEREQAARASAGADAVAGALVGALSAVQTTAALFDWPALSKAEAEGGLRLLYAQSDAIAGVLLHDPARAEAERPAPVGGLAGRAAFDLASGAERLRGATPFAALARHGEKGRVTASAPVVGEGGQPVLPVAVQVSEGPQAAFVAAELVLGGVLPLLKDRAGEAARVDLLDADGRVLASSDGGARLLEPLDEARLHGGRSRRASARVKDLGGMRVLVSLPEDVALAPVRELRRTVLAGAGATLLLLVVAALLFVRGVVGRLGGVARVADAFARGDLSQRAPAAGADELAELARTFNAMGAELEAARTRLTRWNDELRLRVDEATADLRAAQAALLEAQKLAAIGQLGAGVAHEINNPLCGILGNAQLMLLERDPSDDEWELLKSIEESAKRCREITSNLLRFAQSGGAAALRRTDLNAVVRSALQLDARAHPESGVQLEAVLAPGALEVLGDPGQLAQLLQALLSNARTAVQKAPERRVTVSTRVDGSDARLAVEDTGKGIKPEHLPRVFEPFFTTKDVWSNIGLGLSVAYRVAKDHGGRLEVASEEGRGATFTLTLPQYDPSRVPAPAASPAAPPTVGGTGVGIVG